MALAGPGDVDSSRNPYTGQAAITWRKGSPVEYWSASTSQWRSGKIIEITPDRKLLVQFNHNGETRTYEQDAMGIRPQLGDSNEERSYAVRSLEKEKEIEAFAYSLWCTLDKIDVTYVTTQTYGRIATFTGKELVKHIKKYMQEDDLPINMYCKTDVMGSASGRNTEDTVTVEQCQVLLEKNYLFCVFLNPYYDAHVFERAEDAYYQIQEYKKRKFQGMQMPDRLAWSVTTTISVHSEISDEWVPGTITEIKEDEISVTYGPPDHQMRRTFDRFSDDIKSTLPFFRNEWTSHSRLQVLSHSRNTWYEGRVEEVIPNRNKAGNNDILKVVYSITKEDSTTQEYSKYMERWSSSLRPILSSVASPMISESLMEPLSARSGDVDDGDDYGMVGEYMPYESTHVGGSNCPWVKGASVRVYSSLSKTWQDGKIVNLLPTLNAVGVRYGDDEQIVLPIYSDRITLVGSPS